jgi:AraC-like DNA-binding protein
MSTIRHQRGTRFPDGKVWVRSFAVGFTAGAKLDAHQHDWHQLSYAAHGVLKVETPQGAWVAPPHRAAWIPAGVRHHEEFRSRGTLRNLYFATGTCRGMPADCATLDVSPLLRELIVYSAEVGALDVRQAEHLNLAKVLLNQLHQSPRAPVQPLPMPRDSRALAVATRLMTDPSDDADLEAWADRVGASKRTLQRAFMHDTRISFSRWRQRARLLAAVERLSAGESVTRTALDVGYASVSAFVSSFRREFGAPPGRFINE